MSNCTPSQRRQRKKAIEEAARLEAAQQESDRQHLARALADRDASLLREEDVPPAPRFLAPAIAWHPLRGWIALAERVIAVLHAQHLASRAAFFSRWTSIARGPRTSHYQ